MFMPSTDALVDTNLLLVLAIGLTDRDMISRFKRTAAYSAADYDLLVEELAPFRQVVTTPTVLAETSNHLGQLGSPARESALGRLFDMVLVWQEHYRASASVMRDADYLRLGLTDVAICDAALAGRTIFTTDLGLYLTLSRRGASVVNFNHLRSERLGL